MTPEEDWKDALRRALELLRQELVADWRRVLRYAWSIRFIALALLFSAAEIALPLMDGYLPVEVPRSLFAGLAGLSSGLAFVFRLKAQKEFKDVRTEEAEDR